MKKRMLSLVMGFVLLISLMAGSVKAANTDEEWDGEVSQIIVTYMTLGTTPADLSEIQDEVNERTVKKIGVEVELRPVSAFDAIALFPTWLSTGERIDLMMPLLQDLRTYVDQGLVDPVEDLIAENAPYLSQLIEEGQPLISNNYIDGSAYAIMTVPNIVGSNGAFIATKTLVDEVADQWTYDPDKIYTYDELGELFEAIKEKHPEMYPCGVVSTGRATSEYAYATTVAMDTLAGSAWYSGCLIGEDSTTIVDLFETEEYKDYLNHLREWNLAGYIHPDAATMDSSVNALQDSGVSAGYFMVGAPIQAGDDDYIINLSQNYQRSSGMGGWVIPMTAEEPEAAIRFVDLVWKDAELANLIQWGIEGKHYEMLDESIGLIGFPNGVTSTTSGYYNTLGIWGDIRSIYIWSASVTQADNDAYSEKSMAHPTKGIGIDYSSENVVNEMTAISAVVAQYIPALESGSVDLDTYYPEFIQALKAAGIDTVVEDKQAQFDAQYNK